MASSSNDNPESFAALGLYPDVYSFYLMWRTSIRLSLALSTLILYFISLNSHLQDDFLILDL